MARLWVVRHGETDWNREHRLQGHTDVPLNATGREQAADVAARLSAELPRPLPVFTSDLRRARETAEAVARALRVPRLHALRALRERSFGVAEGRTWQEVAREHAAAVEAYRSERDKDAIPGSERWDAFRARTLSALLTIARRVAPEGRSEAGEAVVVTHGGVLRLLLTEAHGPGKQFLIPNTAVYRFELVGRELRAL